jgi:hypothetical protein
VSSLSAYRRFYDRAAARGKVRPAPGMTGYYFPSWPISAASPVFAGARPPSGKNLKTLEAWFSRRGVKPYFSVLAGTDPALRPFTKAARANGWDLDALRTVNVWNTPLPFEGRLGDEILFGDFFDPRVQRPFRRVSREVFGKKPGMFDRIERYQRELKAASRLVIVTRRGTAIAAGSVVTAGSSAQLLAGAVLPRYRGRGLWKTLVGARQALSAFDGAKRWFLVTDNERIAGKSNESFVLGDYRPR